MLNSTGFNTGLKFLDATDLRGYSTKLLEERKRERKRPAPPALAANLSLFFSFSSLFSLFSPLKQLNKRKSTADGIAQLMTKHGKKRTPTPPGVCPESPRHLLDLPFTHGTCLLLFRRLETAARSLATCSVLSFPLSHSLSHSLLPVSRRAGTAWIKQEVANV